MHETAAADCRSFCISHVCTNAKTKVRYGFGFIHQENLMSLQPDKGTTLLMHTHPYIIPFQ
jgi:sorbitol-specific phosphotransferase system component IIA